MDFNNGLYVFNGVPGLEASKGERIAKCFEKLESKIKHLEQVRNSERETAKSGSTDIEDITLSDVRLKLLFIQFQYLRVRMRRTRYGEEENISAESEHAHEMTESEYCELSNPCKETQTRISLHENVPATMTESVASQTGSVDNYDDTRPTVPISTSSNSVADSDHGILRSESVPTSSKDPLCLRYLNTDDIPFILGASVFESHNLIANVQNLLAKLNTHNKALCGSRFQVPCHSASSFAGKNCHHTKNIMKEISKILAEIEIKQAKEIESLDERNTSHSTRIQVENTMHQESQVNKKKQFKKPTLTNFTTSNGDVRPKVKMLLKSTRNIKKNKHAVPINKIRPNLPQVARQRLLRSIKNLRTQLSEEDISWI